MVILFLRFDNEKQIKYPHKKEIKLPITTKSQKGYSRFQASSLKVVSAGSSQETARMPGGEK
jgi:hypothetical protein